MKKYSDYKQKLKDNYFLKYIYSYNEFYDNYLKFDENDDKMGYLKQCFYYQIHKDTIYKIKSKNYKKHFENKIKEFCNENN